MAYPETNYPDEFKTRCKLLYPDDQYLHWCLDVGSNQAGTVLRDKARDEGIPYKAILEAKSFEEVQALAKVVQEKVQLSDEWYRLYKEQHK